MKILTVEKNICFSNKNVHSACKIFLDKMMLSKLLQNDLFCCDERINELKNAFPLGI